MLKFNVSFGSTIDIVFMVIVWVNMYIHYLRPWTAHTNKLRRPAIHMLLNLIISTQIMCSGLKHEGSLCYKCGSPFPRQCVLDSKLMLVDSSSGSLVYHTQTPMNIPMSGIRLPLNSLWTLCRLGGLKDDGVPASTIYIPKRNTLILHHAWIINT